MKRYFSLPGKDWTSLEWLWMAMSIIVPARFQANQIEIPSVDVDLGVEHWSPSRTAFGSSNPSEHSKGSIFSLVTTITSSSSALGQHQSRTDDIWKWLDTPQLTISFCKLHWCSKTSHSWQKRISARKETMGMVAQTWNPTLVRLRQEDCMDVIVKWRLAWATAWDPVSGSSKQKMRTKKRGTIRSIQMPLPLHEAKSFYLTMECHLKGKHVLLLLFCYDIMTCSCVRNVWTSERGNPSF